MIARSEVLQHTAPEWIPAPSAVPIYRLELVREKTEPYGTARWPATAAAFAASLTDREPYEVVGALFLDSRNQIVGALVAYRGTLSGAQCEPRGVLIPALLANAAGIVLFHNHPSGNPEPSEPDLAFTRRVAEAGDVLGVRLVDHLILGANQQFVSLKERSAL